MQGGKLKQGGFRGIGKEIDEVIEVIISYFYIYYKNFDMRD